MQTGIDILCSQVPSELRGARIGIVTNQTGVTTSLVSTIDALIALQDVTVVSLFGPEHGVRGDAQAGVDVDDATDAQTGLPAFSLYGDTYKPSANMLADVDALVFDIQDAGVRFFTYQSTMLHCLEACSEHGKLFVVLDRPNPIDATRVEGGMLDMAFTSFVGAQKIPARHGMTFGELALMYAAEQGYAKPYVVKMSGWTRGSWFDETDLPWVIPSPNLPTIEAAALYPGTCFFEGTNFSEGRGTTLPFEQIGAPWIDPYRLAKEMTELNLPGFAFRPAWFTPTFSKHSGERCGGVQIHVRDRNVARPIEMAVQLLATMKAMAPDMFAWTGGREGPYSLDVLTGDDRLRATFDAGIAPDALLTTWEQESQDFLTRCEPHLLYS